MSPRYKNIIYSVFLILAVFLVWKYRQSQNIPMVSFTGKTMGPIVYNIKYFDKEKRNFKPQIDSLLKAFNQSLSTYIPNSEISRFNRASEMFKFEASFFYPVLVKSKKIFELTNGAYDPTVMPLVNAWGFGPGEGIHHDSAYIDSLLLFVGFDKIDFNKQVVTKKDPRVQLDFSAAAKGYAVDVVAGFLEAQNIKHLFVEIGGEVVARGMNLQKDQLWKVGILDPNSDQINRFYKAIVALKDKAMATSGNYFNYHVIDGIKFSHTIDPATGYPAVHGLLSASVFVEDCMTADALATAFMVMGYKKTLTILKNNPEIEAFLIFNDKQGEMRTYVTPGMEPLIEPVK